MRRIELLTQEGEFVAVVEIAPFPDTGMPEVVMWGDRVFTRRGAQSTDTSWVYVESFAVVSLTPSPGLLKAEPPPVDRSARCTVGEALAPGVPNTENRGDGQQKGYVVLCEEERKKGFVRPVRRAYVHVGARPKNPLRDLTPDEQMRYASEGYTKYEEYPRSGSSAVGRFWREKDLKSGCGSTTTMGQALAETYARDPGFYSATFCARCGAHFSVGEYGEFVWDGTDEKVGT